jgi:hypothetical protein
MSNGVFTLNITWYLETVFFSISLDREKNPVEKEMRKDFGYYDL